MRPTSPPAFRPDRVVTVARIGGVVHDDPWIRLDDDAALPAAGARVIVSFARFKAEYGTLLSAPIKLGVEIAPSDNVEEIGGSVKDLALIAVVFPGFRDGRGYSTARILRTRLDYRGELRAVGDVLRDQLFLMLRVGFDSFALKDNDPIAALARAHDLHAQAYQGSSDVRRPIWALRLSAAQRAAAE